METADQLIDFVLALQPLSELPRTGWLLRGVRPCESIAEHSFGVALVAMALTDALRARGHTLDGERVLRMALLHDAAEARTGDVPMPVKTAELRRAMKAAERAIAEELLPPDYHAYAHEAEAGESLEARVVRASDKIQMMIRALGYEGQKRGDLREFWSNQGNFRHAELDFAREVFERICARGGHPYPAP
jgi:putative hydrolase of HD superfamily